jgi:uncharacterized membrane protein YgdD (TMEM256/DUF423 family)
MWWRIAGAIGLIGVATGAFGAHALADALTPERLHTWETASRYQLVHAVAIGLVAAHPARPRIAGALFVAGVVLFSGSLYALCLTDVGVLGAITPLGGLCFLGGWLALAIAPTEL